MKSVLLYFLLHLAFAAAAQPLVVNAIFTMDSAYRFPLFESAQNLVLAAKINRIIQTDLGANPDVENPFDSITNEDDFNFEVGANNGRILSLIVTGFHTGAGMHVRRNEYNFDCRTLAQIDLDHLLGTDGHAKLRKALYKSWVESIKDMMKDKNRGGAWTEEYSTCLAEAAKMTEIDARRLLITDSGITVWTDICLDGSNYEYDPVKGPYTFSLGQLLPMLTPYGYSLFVGPSPKGPIQKLLRGAVNNKYPISMTLLPGKNAGTLTGMIVYDKVGQPINLQGTINGDSLTLHEVDASARPVSDIELSWDGSKLSGTFLNLKAKIPMPFVVSLVQ